MELTIYLVGIVCTGLVIATRAKIAATCLLLILVTYVIIVRLAPPQVDMKVYYQLLSNFSPYMLKEFLYYYVTNFLYQILKDRNLVFIVIDLATFGVLMACLRPELGRTRTIIYMAFLLFSFVGVMGLQNIYRQFLASILLTIGFITFEQRKKKTAALAILSAAFIHNASLLLIMLFFMTSVSRAFVQKNLVYFIVGLSVATALFAYFVIGIRIKSNRDTGANMLPLYIILSALVFLLFANRATSHRGTLLRSASFLVMVLPVFLMSGGSSGGERIFMFTFPILLYEVFKYSRHLVFGDRAQELMIFIIFCGPTLAVYSSRQFLI